VLGVSGLIRSDAAALRVPEFGVYAGPGASGVAKALAFQDLTGAPITHVLDFASAKSWDGITGPPWLLGPHAHSHAHSHAQSHAQSHARLEYSLPMLPDGEQYTLAACATGRYDTQWRRLAVNLIGAGLGRTIVRPGWEFNGGWYSWSAAGHAADYVGCFRTIVTTMRSVHGGEFSFDWNPTLGPAKMPAERAYPGDAYVDYVGVDAYDTSKIFAVRNDRGRAARERAWRIDLHGDHGLAFWSSFAAAHHKPLAIPEWGVVRAANREGGGDDAAYVDHMFVFMTDPDNHVAYQEYFDAGSAQAEHRFGAGTLFPRAEAEFRSWVNVLAS
jgi:hypothetical protein